MNRLRREQNHSQSFDEAYRDYITPIYKYVYIRVKHKQEAEDLTHIVFVKALEAGKKSDIDISLNYLFTIARTTVIDFWRKKKSINVTNPEEVFDNIADDNFDIQAEIIANENISEVQKVVDCLNGDQKDVIIMRFINDMTTKEISQVMQKTEGAVRKIQSRAIGVLREKIIFNNISL